MNKKTPEEKTREGLNKLKEKLNKIIRSRLIRRIAVILAAAVIFLCAVIFLIGSIKVKEISVDGDLRAFNETKVVQASEIEIGKGFFSKTVFGIKRNIRKNIPLADEIKVRKNIFTGMISIDISFLPFDYYLEYKNMYYAVDENLVVVDMRNNENDYASVGGKRIDIPKICQPEFGKAIVFYDTVKNPDGDKNFDDSTAIEIKDKSEYNYVFDALELLKASGDYSSLTKINLKNKYDITAVYSERFKVEFGSSASFELKLQMLNAILEDTSWQYTAFGLIDLSNPSAATARAVQSIEDDVEEPDDDVEEETKDNINGPLFGDDETKENTEENTEDGGEEESTAA